MSVTSPVSFRGRWLSTARFGILLACASVLATATAWGAPRYADKDSALDLAGLLDKAVFRNQLVSSTFVQGVGHDQYLLKVVLDNGAEQDWDMHQLRQWSKDESLVLQKNRALLFPKETTNAYLVLDKNEFADRALQSKVLAKTYGEDDVLAGQTINYAIYEFNLTDLLNLNPGTDSQGYRYHYVFDLENGQREFMSYLDAANTLAHNGLIENPAAVQPVMRAPYRLKSLTSDPLKMVNGVGRFAVNLVFDRPVELTAGDFPFQLYERPAPGLSSKGPAPFVIEFTAPNANLSGDITPIQTLEFLQGIHAVPDQGHQNRVLMRANINPDVLNTPPEVEIQGDSVHVTFTKVADQSVFDRKALLEADLRRRQDKLLNATLTPEEVNRRNTNHELMETGLGQVDRARNSKAFQEKFDLLVAALANFSGAAVSASTDEGLEQALKQRNYVMEKLPNLVMDQARQAVQQKPVPNQADLVKDLDTVINLIREPKTVATLRELQQQVQAP